MVLTPEQVKKLFLGSAEHVFASPEGAPLPPEALPEIAFIGRSNVGKSSLINALLQRKKLARTSNTPGATRAIHFYNIENTFHVVDLPGYGYAKLSKTLSERLARHVDWYLQGRGTLKAVCVLVDMRHGPKQLDFEMVQSLAQSGLPSIIVLTKADKLKIPQQKAAYAQYEKAFADVLGLLAPPMLTSAQTGFGLEELRVLVYNALGQPGAV